MSCQIIGTVLTSLKTSEDIYFLFFVSFLVFLMFLILFDDSRGKTDSQKGKGVPPAVPPTPPPSPLDSFLLDTPIQFDMISPMDEPTMQVSLPGTVKESDGQLGPPKRINPFSQSSSQIRDDQRKFSLQ